MKKNLNEIQLSPGNNFYIIRFEKYVYITGVEADNSVLHITKMNNFLVRFEKEKKFFESFLAFIVQ